MALSGRRARSVLRDRKAEMSAAPAAAAAKLAQDICKQECVHSTRMPHSHYHFLCLVDCEIGVNTLIWHLN